ncbi:MAG: DUF86 domain-containing protein [Alphaproteobacteria bacterium]|nr:DUF86 domain-containing protein [Alphaproteobacteria bacterium]
MTDEPPRLDDYLAHINEAITRIETYVSGLDRPAFLADRRTQDAVIRNLEIIGEACRNILRRHPEVTAANPDIPWLAAYEMRNALTHGYFQVDLEIVWRTINTDLRAMARDLGRLRRKRE